MSSKLVRKGLELVNCEKDFKKRKLLEKKKKKKQPKKRRTTVNDRPRGFQDIRLSSGQLKKEPEVDYTAKNLEYFKKTTWTIDKDTYDKILERQNKSRKKRNCEEKQESEEESTGLFDD